MFRYGETESEQRSSIVLRDRPVFRAGLNSQAAVNIFVGCVQEFSVTSSQEEHFRASCYAIGILDLVAIMMTYVIVLDVLASLHRCNYESRGSAAIC